jgi:hypothetical protein
VQLQEFRTQTETKRSSTEEDIQKLSFSSRRVSPQQQRPPVTTVKMATTDINSSGKLLISAPHHLVEGDVAVTEN